MRYWTVGVGDLEAAYYAEDGNPIARGLAAWMRSPVPHRVKLKLRLVEKILGKLEEGPYRDVLFDAVQSYYPLMPLEREGERRLLESRENIGPPPTKMRSAA